MKETHGGRSVVKKLSSVEREKEEQQGEGRQVEQTQKD